MTAPPPPPTTRRRVDASMTLLHEVMHRPLDPGYAAAARRAQDEPDDPATRRRARTVTIALAAVAGIVVGAAVIDLRLPATVGSRTVLSDEIRTRTAHADDLEVEVAALQGEIDDIGADALAGHRDAVIEEAQLLARVTGSAPVVGPGVRVVLDDAQPGSVGGSTDPRGSEDIDKGRVRDRDLQIVVNGLWEAGAEAVAINGQRLTSMSSIREAGSAVLVNFRPLVPPYDIHAIGQSHDLQVAFASSAAGRYLASLQQNYGVRASISGANSLTLPAVSGLGLRHAEPDIPSEVSEQTAGAPRRTGPAPDTKETP